MLASVGDTLASLQLALTWAGQARQIDPCPVTYLQCKDVLIVALPVDT